MGKGKSTNIDTPAHSAAPLSTLKDPSAFGPPPKHVAVYGQQAADDSSKNRGETGSGRSPPPIPTSRPQVQAHPDTQEDIGSSTPVAPTIASGRGLETMPSESSQGPYTATGTSTRPPKPPPRLPPRRSTHAREESSPPPPYHEANEEVNEQTGYINQAAVGKLGRAGVSVPGLGIGSSAQSPGAGSPAVATSPGQLDELQSRFAKMGRRDGVDQRNTSPEQGTSWAQKQAALKTAASFRRDPSSVSMSDARAAASTANNFRQRHGDQVGSGLEKANGFSERLGARGGEGESTTPHGEDEANQSKTPAVQAAAKKKPPPPPKKSTAHSTESPPPVPVSSKPRPG